MYRKKIPFVLILISFIVSLSGCTNGSRIFTWGRTKNEDSLSRMLTWEGRELESEVPEERVKEIEDAIASYQEILDEKVKAGMEIGLYYKTLALEYMTHDMYGLALVNLKEALYYFPTQYTLNFLAGVSSAQLAKSTANSTERNTLLVQAEHYYLRALELAPHDGDINYALGVLYFYEMEQTLKAEDIMLKMLKYNPGHFKGLYLLGNVQASLGKVEEAAASFEAVAESAEDESLKEAAMENRDLILGERF